MKKSDKFRFVFDFENSTCQLFINNCDLGIIWDSIHTHLVSLVSNYGEWEAEYSVEWL